LNPDQYLPTNFRIARKSMKNAWIDFLARVPAWGADIGVRGN
jgi:hypothetical protein